MKLLDDGPAKQAVIDRMVALSQRDAPWSFGYFPFSSAAAQSWVHNFKPAVLIRDHGKYLRLDIDERVRKLEQWNRPVWWPMILGGVALLALVLIGWRSLRRRERMNARGEVLA
jgi:hypothetical protein